MILTYHIYLLFTRLNTDLGSEEARHKQKARRMDVHQLSTSRESQDFSYDDMKARTVSQVRPYGVIVSQTAKIYKADTDTRGINCVRLLYTVVYGCLLTNVVYILIIGVYLCVYLRVYVAGGIKQQYSK